MADWPSTLISPPNGVISHHSMSSMIGEYLPMSAGSLTNAVWPAANLAIYVPFMVEVPVTAYQMGFEVAVQSGNLDVGIYDVLGNRLVSKGSTAVAAAGIQLVDITDTVLTPAVYFSAMCVDNITASFTRSAPTALIVQVCGVQQQAVGAVTLPATATFANPANTYIPAVSIALNATI